MEYASLGASREPPCIWTFLSSLGKNEFFSVLLGGRRLDEGMVWRVAALPEFRGGSISSSANRGRPSVLGRPLLASQVKVRVRAYFNPANASCALATDSEWLPALWSRSASATNSFAFFTFSLL